MYIIFILFLPVFWITTVCISVSSKKFLNLFSISIISIIISFVATGSLMLFNQSFMDLHQNDYVYFISNMFLFCLLMVLIVNFRSKKIMTDDSNKKVMIKQARLILAQGLSGLIVFYIFSLLYNFSLFSIIGNEIISTLEKNAFIVLLLVGLPLIPILLDNKYFIMAVMVLLIYLLLNFSLIKGSVRGWMIFKYNKLRQVLLSILCFVPYINVVLGIWLIIMLTKELEVENDSVEHSMFQ